MRRSTTSSEALPEGAEVRSVAEAARRDGHKLAAGLEERDCDGEKGGVEIRLGAEGLQQAAGARVRVDLPVRWIEDGAVELLPGAREEAARQGGNASLDEVLSAHITPEPNTGALAV